MSTAKIRSAVTVLGTLRTVLHLARVATRCEAQAWVHIEPSGVHEDKRLNKHEAMVTLWTQAVMGTVERHLGLLSVFAVEAARLVAAEETEQLEAHVRRGVPGWGDVAEIIARADAAWERGDDLEIGEGS